ncbi:unnamed protein product [Prunus brigantina]
MATEKVTESFVQPAIPQFDDHYDHWNMLMQNFLTSKECWHLVESGIDSPIEGVTLSEQQQKRFYEQKLKDLKDSKNVVEMRIDEPQSFLLVHEQRLNRTTASEEQTALKASTFSESSSSRGGRGRGKGGRGQGRGGRGN